MEELNIAIVVSRFNEEVTNKLLDHTFKTLEKRGFDREEITLFEVPGALEIPLIAHKLSPLNDAVICLGAVIRGETSHYDIVCENVARSLSDISLKHDIPIINGVLTVDNVQQGLERVNRGQYFADSAIEMALMNMKLDEELELETEDMLDFLESFSEMEDFEKN